jgi:hypothetical protein
MTRVVDGQCGTKGWMAPEIEEMLMYNPIKADRWSTGKILHYLLVKFNKEDTVLGRLRGRTYSRAAVQVAAPLDALGRSEHSRREEGFAISARCGSVVYCHFSNVLRKVHGGVDKLVVQLREERRGGESERENMISAEIGIEQQQRLNVGRVWIKESIAANWVAASMRIVAVFLL